MAAARVRDDQFDRYRVLLLKKTALKLPVLEHLRVFNSYPVFQAMPIEGIPTDVQVGRWRTFEGPVLRAHFGERWPKVLAAELTPERRKSLLIEGVDAEGRRYPLPLTRGETNTPSAEPPKAGRRLGSGLNVLIRHLRDIAGVQDYAVLVQMCQQSGLPWASEPVRRAGADPRDRTAVLRKAYSNGKTAHAEGCSYCTNGLPEPWRSLVAAYKGT